MASREGLWGMEVVRMSYLSSLVISTPTEGGAARMSVISGRNLWRISFNEVQPVCT